MPRSINSFRARLGRLLQSPVPIRVPHVGKILACFSILGVAGLCYVFGAAVMFFQLPSSEFLYEAFTGTKAWHERGQPVVTPFLPPPGDERQGVTVDRPSQTYDGFTLVTTVQGSRATLLDMHGNVVHKWELPFSQAWPSAPHVQDPLRDDQIHWFRCHVFPNGDLLAIYQLENDTPCGYGLVKLNKDSKLLWKYGARVHHDLDVDEQGMIYALTQEVKRQAPAGLEYLPVPYVADFLVVLSPDGKELASVSIEEAFRDSPYQLLLSTAIGEQAASKDRTSSTSAFDSVLGPLSKGDLFHTNSVKVLSSARAGQFPLFKAGQVLLSLRSLNCLAVLDVRRRSLVWAGARSLEGPTRRGVFGQWAPAIVR